MTHTAVPPVRFLEEESEAPQRLSPPGPRRALVFIALDDAVLVAALLGLGTDAGLTAAYGFCSAGHGAPAAW